MELLLSKKIVSIDNEGKIIENGKDKANIFAEKFAEISSDKNYSTSFKMFKAEIAEQESERDYHVMEQIEEMT